MASIAKYFDQLNRNAKSSNNRINKFKSIIVVQYIFIILSIFLLPKCAQCDDSLDSYEKATTTAAILIKSSNTIKNKLVINTNGSIINPNLITSQNLNQSSNLLSHNKSNESSNRKAKNNYVDGNDDVPTWKDDVLSVENFQRNVEHKFSKHDDDDAADDNERYDASTDSPNSNDKNNKYVYNTLSADGISGVNTDDDNIIKSNLDLQFYDLKKSIPSPQGVDGQISDTMSTSTGYRRETRAVRRSICEIGCKCEKDNAFTTVICDFNEKTMMDPVFGAKLEVPSKTSSFVVKLNRNTQFRIDEGLFENNAINSIRIDGSTNGNDQIEINRNSLKGNNGPYPEIVITDVGTVILRSNSFSGEFRLNVKNCDYVKIYENAFHNTSFEGQFTQIEDLHFDVGAFNQAQAKISIDDSKIDILQKFKASLREIKFENCTIGTIDTGAFDVNNINSIVFSRCKIDVFRTKAITEKLLSHNFSITNANIRVMESEAISGSGITELVLKHNIIDEIQSNAIYVFAVNATISENSINKLGDKWLRIKDFTHIHINQNQFGEFGSMVLEQPPTSPNSVFCKFENNSITTPMPGSLNIPNKHCIVREISFYRFCSCNTTWLKEVSTRDLRSLSYCRVEENLKYCLKRPVYNVLAWLNEVCNYNTSKLDCMKSLLQKDVNSKFIDPNSNSGFDFNWLYIIAGIIFLAMTVAIMAIFTFKCYSKRKQMQQQQTATHLSESTSAASTSTPNGTAQKQHHGFTNEDRRIIKQTLNELKESYPTEVYEEVNRNAQILLCGNITETQRVKAIDDIVQVLEECQSNGEDFVAFTDILYKNLAPSSASAPPIEPTYSEPVLQEEGSVVYAPHTGNRQGCNNRTGIGGAYASTAVVPGLTDLQTNIDHIYAEPTSAQQPLLTNEYASPADRSDDNMVDLYSEPISNERDRKIIPPYACIQTKAYLPTSQQSTSSKAAHHQRKMQLPSSSSMQPNQTNLPDVLNPSSTSISMAINSNNNSNINNKNNISNNNFSNSSFKPLTNVQKMAKSFSNDPSFHITRSPTSNRRIPKYTVPNKRQAATDPLSPHHQQPLASTSLFDAHDTGNISLSPSGDAAGIITTSNSIVSGDNQSNHSGGSDITVQMDDIIEYVDA